MTKLARDVDNTPVQAFTCAGSVTSTATISAAAASIPASDATNTIVRIAATDDCFIAIGSVATTASMPLFGGGTEYFSRPRGAAVSVIGTEGTLYVTEVN